MNLEEYVRENHPEIIEHFKRKTTPNYYECGVEYYYLTHYSGSRNKILVLRDCTIFKNKIWYNLYDKNDPSKVYLVTDGEIHLGLERVNEDVEYHNNIINDGKVTYLTTKYSEYQIKYLIWRHYESNRICFRIIIQAIGSGSFYEYYNVIGKGEPVLKFHRGRDEYDIEFKVSVRRMKEIIFGDPNIKIPSSKGIVK